MRKPGWQVPEALADAVRQAVEDGHASSQNAFIEHALLRHLAEVRRERIYQAYADAAKDPIFAADMARVTSDYEIVSGDGLPKKSH